MFDSVEEVTEYLIPALRDKFLWPYQSDCISCFARDHFAWVKIYCGSCNKQWWVYQTNFSRGLWCHNCSFDWNRESPQQALTAITGDNIRNSLARIENREDLQLRELAWQVQHFAKRILANRHSGILDARCSHDIHIPTAWQIPPNQWEYRCHEFARIANRRQHYYRKTSQR